MKACAEPRCPNRVERGRCAEHAKAYDLRRGSSRERGYTHTWDVRSAAFRTRYPLCGMRPNGLPSVGSACADKGLSTVAEVTDHVRAHKGDTRLFWDQDNNWQSLCGNCNRLKAIREEGGFGRAPEHAGNSR